MFCKHKRTQNLIVGGALIGAFFVSPAYAYDQMNTHPALTNEIVNFYNLNYPEKLSKTDKELLIKGAIDEDQGIRPMNHFYDPVHNIGMAGFPTSKQWAMSSAAQSNFAIANHSIAESAGLIKSADDFSHQRALEDYAHGDRQRAMIAFGHVLHLLEDANVPDHTRNDPHPPIGHLGSPYEHEMAKWNLGNFKIASKLQNEGIKPVALKSIGDYFDKIAKYSNGNFFSKDTIFSSEYMGPVLDFWEYKQTKDGHTYKLGYKKDFDRKYILVKEITEENLGNQKQVFTIADRDILDGYWERLSKDIVLNGTGALNLFLVEAEKAKKEYANKPSEKNWFAKLLGLIGIDTNGLTTRRVVSPQVVDNSNVGDSMVTPTPKVTKLSVSPRPLVTKTPVTNVTMLSPDSTLSPQATPSPSKSPTPTPPTPAVKITSSSNNAGGGGGGSSSVSSTPSPTPSPTLTPSPTPTPTLSPSVTPIPSLTPEPSGSSSTSVVINEVAWMGTATSSNDEWMELYNTTNQTVDLTGWTLKSKDGTPNIALSGTVAPLAFYLLERTNDSVISDLTADKIYTGALGNSGESLELRDSSGNLKDSAGFASGWPAGDNTTKTSMERIDPKKSGDDSTNWATNNSTIKNGHDASGKAVNGTPRTSNSVYVSLKPSAVTNLAATGLNGNFGKFLLTWSAPSDSDTLPTNLAYDFRYSTKSFATIDDWDKGYKLASVSLPGVAEPGALASASFNVFNSYNQKWFFALKTKDQANVSDISNIADATTKSALSDSWSMLGGNPHHMSLLNVAGVATNATISWSFDVSGVVSPPVVSAEGHIYFGASDGSSGKLIKLDKNGVKQWEYSTNVSIGTPAVLSDGTVYFGRVGAGGVLAFTALNPDGSKKWDYNDASTVKAVTVSSDGKAYFTYSSGTDKLAILNPDGSGKTTVSNSGLNGFTPIVLENGNIIVARRVSGNQFFTAYSSVGLQLWDVAYTGANGNIQSNPSYDQSTGKTYSAVGSKLFDIPSGGSVLNVHQVDSLGIAATMVAISSDTLYVGFNDINSASGSRLFAIKKSDLTNKWSTPFSVNSRLNSQLAVDKDDNIYFSTESGALYSVNKDGSQNWKIDAGTASTISPVLTQNGIIWGYGNRLTGIGVK